MKICAGVPSITRPAWVKTTMANWCDGCEAGYPHYPGDIPEYYGEDCAYYKLINMKVYDDEEEEST